MSRYLLVLCGLLCLPISVFAGLFSNPYNHYYIDVGAVGYYLQQPELEVGTVGTNATPSTNTTAPLAKSRVNSFAPRLDLSGGYWFMNCNNNWVSKLFGHEEAFEATINYTYLDHTISNDHLGNGNVWYIDGSGSILNPNVPTNLYDFKLNSKLHNISTGLYFKGKVYTTNPHLTMLRYVGIVYNYYNNEYDYKLKYNQGASPNTEDEKFNVIAHYFGVAIGSQLNYQIGRHFIPFIDLEVRLLSIMANLHATQSAPGAVRPSMTVNNSVSTFNYQAIAAVGVNFQFNETLKSPTIGLRAGIDHWNYVPRVVPPNRAGDKPVHLVGESINSGFAMLDVKVPFG